MALTTGNEDQVSKYIEDKTSHVPSTAFLGAAIIAMGVSAGIKCMGHDKTALFIGQWAAPFLLLGIYNKIVKTEGHD